MFFHLLQRFLPDITMSTWKREEQAGSSTLDFILALALIVATWRVWKFSLLPAIRPLEPKELPYWIPFLGHAVSFFKNSHKTLTYGREYFGNTRDPFTIVVAGQRLCIITSSQDVQAVYKNTLSLTFDDYIRDMMLSFEMTPLAVDKMWQTPRVKSALISPNPLNKSLVQLGEDFYKQQLYPGPKLEILQKTLMPSIHQSLRWDSISKNITRSSTSDTKTLSLLGWCRDILLDSATRSFFGDRLLEVEPDLFQTFFDFDDNSWKLTYKLPRFMSQDMYKAKKKTMDALTAYYELPMEERSGSAWIIKTLEAEMRQLGIGSSDIASLMMMTFWVINGNAYKVCFWILAYLLYHPELLSIIRTEVIPVVNEGTTNLESRLECCPRLEAVFNEVVRLTSSSSSVRDVTSTTVIGGKILDKGTKVLIPYRQLHLNGEVFGSDPLHFDADRFFVNKDLSRSSSYRPFGGGVTYCPGRILARREVITFVALILYRFDIDLTEGEIASASKFKPRFPRLDEGKPCLGIMGPVNGEDVFVTIKQASH